MANITSLVNKLKDHNRKGRVTQILHKTAPLNKFLHASPLALRIPNIRHIPRWACSVKYFAKNTHTHSHALTHSLTSNTSPWDHHVHTLLHTILPMICLIFSYKKICVSVSMATEPIHESHWSEEEKEKMMSADM